VLDVAYAKLHECSLVNAKRAAGRTQPPALGRFTIGVKRQSDL